MEESTMTDFEMEMMLQETDDIAILSRERKLMNSFKSYQAYLESKMSRKIENKHYGNFSRNARYLGNGIYEWLGIHSTDTCELFCLGCLSLEDILVYKL